MAENETTDRDDAEPALTEGRRRLLAQIEDWLETPMLVLALLWLLLLVVELVFGLTPFLAAARTAIWLLFVLDFLFRFVVAPEKLSFLRRNILTLPSLLLPAVRLLRVARILRLAAAARGLRLVRLVGSLNRGIAALRGTMRARGLPYVIAATLLVAIVGAAGMYAFERGAGGPGFGSYGEALWWTAMLLTSIGSEVWPQTAEGRLLCLLLSVYGFAVFGYVTATFASLFIGVDLARGPDAAIRSTLREVERELGRLRQQLEARGG